VAEAHGAAAKKCNGEARNVVNAFDRRTRALATRSCFAPTNRATALDAD
jgi:hypothetical protein